MKRPTSTHFTLKEASRSDIPAIARIHIAAFAHDNISRLSFKDDATRQQKLEQALEAAFSNPNGTVIKAVDKKSTDEILGWTAFGSLGSPESQAEEARGPGITAEMMHPLGISQVLGGHPLREYLAEEFGKARNNWLAGKRYIYIGALATDPRHQGKGVGTALVHWVTLEADWSRVPCWLESTPVGHPLYLRAGFRDVGNLEVDLRDFVPGAKGGKWGWGPYEFRIMLRLPEDGRED